MNKKRIWLVEDDFMQSQILEDSLPALLARSIEIDVIRSESAFRDCLERSKLPDLIVLDMGLVWAQVSPNIPDAPPEVANGPYKAGNRCLAELDKRDPDHRVPVIVYTILEEANLPAPLPVHARFLRKNLNDLQPLARQIQALAGITESL